ncbi:hypothetical protein [Spiroplasma endosymbiont of Dasysyrphus albostriatus]|uniref:hypothetical protein n=1 Tax=Spiroplasma endosymbiont of Dasysyrphus albostriatus TaxID=3066299 RepID=UPI0030CA647B
MKIFNINYWFKVWTLTAFSFEQQNKKTHDLSIAIPMTNNEMITRNQLLIDNKNITTILDFNLNRIKRETNSIDNINIMKIYELNLLQIQELTKKQIQNIQVWDITIIREKQISWFKLEQISWFKPEQISWFKSWQISEFTEKQIQEFLPLQIRSLTPVQVKSLTKQQVSSFYLWQILEFKASQLVQLSPLKKQYFTSIINGNSFNIKTWDGKIKSCIHEAGHIMNDFNSVFFKDFIISMEVFNRENVTGITKLNITGYITDVENTQYIYSWLRSVLGGASAEIVMKYPYPYRRNGHEVAPNIKIVHEMLVIKRRQISNLDFQILIEQLKKDSIKVIEDNKIAFSKIIEICSIWNGNTF